jgi:hypothetical protein
MEYMILIHSDESVEMPEPGSPEFDAMMGEWAAYNQRLIDGGHWVAGASLQPTVTATIVRTAPGAAPVISDGPFVESKEQFGGFYLVKAADLDQAIELATAIPAPGAVFEVRPVAYRPDAD